MDKEIKIVPPEGYTIDEENSTFKCIKFKPVENKRWGDDAKAKMSGYYISSINADIVKHDNALNMPINYHLFATEKQAKSALAMARISQIMANDSRFGGVITDEEWKLTCNKYTIERCYDKVEKACCVSVCSFYNFLAFHTEEQRDLFLEENEDLVKDYLML